MSLHDLSNKMEAYNVNKLNGWGVDISYTVRATGLPQATRAMPKSNMKSETSTDGNTIDSSMAFLSVTLNTKPSRNDYIEYLSETWIVENFVDGGSGMYDIYCYASRRLSGKRSKREF